MTVPCLINHAGGDRVSASDVSITARFSSWWRVLFSFAKYSSAPLIGGRNCSDQFRVLCNVQHIPCIVRPMPFDPLHSAFGREHNVLSATWAHSPFCFRHC